MNLRATGYSPRRRHKRLVIHFALYPAMLKTASRRSTLMLTLGTVLALTACGGGGGDSGTPVNQDPYGWNAVTALKVQDTTVGTGTQADTTKNVTVHYTGYLYDVRVANTKGTQFDTSVGKNPFA